ncbi:DUF4384 domain-containing protein [Aquabacterium humicola]|uniref:DUF4384 domain-containing protein n=1 Tax=Aquabacterium humicola TaxID=3237377 RepID=UPI0025435E56|nr:DUF4384 domain-containing protein [Rubrivivax pictus]
MDVLARSLRLLAALALPALIATPTPAAAAPEPQRVISDAAALRRCVDHLLLDHGARDLLLQVGEIDERAARGAGGLRELLLTAAADMSARSRAVRLLAAPAASGAAGATAPVLTGSLRRETSVDAFTLDLSLQAPEDRSQLPGSGSRHGVTLAGGQAELQKFGTRLVVPAAGGDTGAAALRLLADVAAAELIGRLAKVPYWRCFGAGLDDPAVAAEVQDWFDTMATRPSQLIGWFQQQLRLQRLWDGPLDGEVSPALKDAIGRYRARLNLSREPKLTLDFFQAALSAEPAAAPAPPPPSPALPTTPPAAPSAAPPAPVAPVAPPAPAATAFAVAPRPLELRIAGPTANGFGRGEAVRLSVRPSRDAHVYCFLQDEQRRITRFFPNRFQADSRIGAATGLQLPGAMRFEITMNPQGLTETVTCFGTERDVLAALPGELAGADFAALPLASLDQLRQAFVAVTDGTLAQDSFQIRARR